MTTPFPPFFSTDLYSSKVKQILENLNIWPNSLEILGINQQSIQIPEQ